MKRSKLDRKGISDDIVELISRLVAQICWPARRQAMGQVSVVLLDGKARVAESVFGWSRKSVELGIHELQSGVVCRNELSARRRLKVEEKHPQLIADIHEIMKPQAQADSHLRTTLLYTDLTAQRVYEALGENGWSATSLPTVRTISNLLKRLDYRRRSVAKTKVKKNARNRRDLRSSQRSPRSSRGRAQHAEDQHGHQSGDQNWPIFARRSFARSTSAEGFRP